MAHNPDYFDREVLDLGDGWHMARLWLRQSPDCKSEWYIAHGDHDCYEAACMCGAKIPASTIGIKNMLNGLK